MLQSMESQRVRHDQATELDCAPDWTLTGTQSVWPRWEVQHWPVSSLNFCSCIDSTP